MGRKDRQRLGKPAAGAERVEVTVTEAQAGLRLDQALAALTPLLSRAHARRVIGMGAVYLGTQRCRVASRLVEPGDALTATWHPDVRAAELFDLDVVHEDAEIVVVAKPPGQLSQGSELGDVGSLAYALLKRFGADVRLMHRLDKPASGLLVAARTPRASAFLTPQFREHTISRRYCAVVQGAPADGDCDAQLVREGRKMRVAAPGEQGISARTHLKTIRTEGGRSLVEAQLFTGRTHQIRLHLAHLGTPIVGDRRYGGPPADRMCLHAVHLGLTHPDGFPLSWDRPPDESFWAASGLAPT